MTGVTKEHHRWGVSRGLARQAPPAPGQEGGGGAGGSEKCGWVHDVTGVTKKHPRWGVSRGRARRAPPALGQGGCRGVRGRSHDFLSLPCGRVKKNGVDR